MCIDVLASLSALDSPTLSLFPCCSQATPPSSLLLLKRRGNGKNNLLAQVEIMHVLCLVRLNELHLEGCSKRINRLPPSHQNEVEQHRMRRVHQPHEIHRVSASDFRLSMETFFIQSSILHKWNKLPLKHSPLNTSNESYACDNAFPIVAHIDICVDVCTLSTNMWDKWPRWVNRWVTKKERAEESSEKSIQVSLSTWEDNSYPEDPDCAEMPIGCRGEWRLWHRSGQHMDKSVLWPFYLIRCQANTFLLTLLPVANNSAAFNLAFDCSVITRRPSRAIGTSPLSCLASGNSATLVHPRSCWGKCNFAR